jgi:hypothetical protein
MWIIRNWGERGMVPMDSITLIILKIKEIPIKTLLVVVVVVLTSLTKLTEPEWQLLSSIL